MLLTLAAIAGGGCDGSLRPIPVAEDPAPASGYKRRVSLDVKDAWAPQVVEFLRHQTGEDIQIVGFPPPNALPNPPPRLEITLSVEDAPLSQILNEIAQQIACSLSRRNGAWVLRKQSGKLTESVPEERR